MNYIAILESILFVRGEEGITIEEISDLLDISNEDSLHHINDLILKYNDNNSGIMIEKYGDYYKLVTKKEYKEYIERLVEIDNSNSLTEATLETLAIIAYNEPVTRIKVDEIRGVSSSHMIRKLVNCGLVKELGRSDLPGRPNLYGTTPLFLDHFGLKCIEELPKLIEIDSVQPDEVDLFKSKYSEEKNI